MLQILFIVIHILISIVLCVAVLLQSSKGGGLAGAFGGSGGAPQQLLGSRGMTTLLHKVTIWCGIGFMITSLALFMMSGTTSQGVLQQQEPAPTSARPLSGADEAGPGVDDGAGALPPLDGAADQPGTPASGEAAPDEAGSEATGGASSAQPETPESSGGGQQ